MVCIKFICVGIFFLLLIFKASFYPMLFSMDRFLYAESVMPIPEMDAGSEQKGIVSKIPVELKGGDWTLKVIPWIGGRIVSMAHLPSGNA